MPAIVVALVFQLAWLVTRIVLEHNGIAVTNGRVMVLSVASLAASYVIIAAASAGLARRLTGTRRLGAWIATLGSLSLIAGLALYEVLLHSAVDHPDAMAWAISLRVYGWSIADAVAILGFAIAAGRTGIWLAPLAIGLALMKVQPGLSQASWSSGTLLVLLAAKAVLVVIIARVAESDAEQCEPEPSRARSALRRCELSAWLGAALSPLFALAWFASPTIYVAIAWACGSMVVIAIYAEAAWSNARAGLAKSPQWPWHAASMLSVWALARMLRTWLLTFAHHWNNLEATPLKLSHWSTAIPGLLAAVCALGALAIFGQRTGRREVILASLAAATLSALAFSVQCALPTQGIAHGVCAAIASLAAARAYRVARLAIDSDVPRARVV